MAPSNNILTGHEGFLPKKETPPWKYQEYPKLVTNTSGQRVEVRDAEEEARATGKAVEAAVPGSEGAGKAKEKDEADEFADLTKAQIVEKFGLDLDPNRITKEEIIARAKEFQISNLKSEIPQVTDDTE